MTTDKQGELTLPVGDRDHLLGNPRSVITLLEYGDYECPYCGRAHVEVKRLLAELGDTIRFSFRNFPLSQIHPYALTGALAAEAAAQQDQFWNMHNMILENQRGLSSDKIRGFAKTLSLDLEQFARDMEAPELSDRVQEDFMSGVRSGVNGTPTFFINGKRHNGTADFESLRDALTRCEI